MQFFEMDERTRRNAIWLLFLAVFIDLLGFGIILPQLPFLAADLGANEFEYGLLIAVYSFSQFVMAPIWGRVSDRIGRKPVILSGLGGSVIGFAIFALSTNLVVLFIARIIQGIFTASTLTTANAMIADIIPPKDRGPAFGLLTSAFGLGFALGPAIGGVLAAPYYAELFSSLVGQNVPSHAGPSLFAAILSLLNFVAALFLLKESLLGDNRVQEKSGKMFAVLDIGKLRQYPGALFMVTIFAIVAFGFSNQITSFAIFAPGVDPSVEEPELGLFYTLAGFILFISQPLYVKPLHQRIGETRTAFIASIFIFIGFILIPMTQMFTQMLLAGIPLVVGISMMNPSVTSSLSKAVDQRIQGFAMGVNQSLASLMRVIGPLLAGYLLLFDIRLPYYFGSGIFIVVIFLLYQHNSKKNAMNI